MNPSTLFLDRQNPQVGRDGKLTDQFWNYLTQIQAGLGTIDLAAQVIGILPSANGGTGHNNLGFTITGATTAVFQGTGTQTLVATTSPITAVELTVSQGVTPNSGGIKHSRITTGSVVGGGSALITVTWPTPFADASYTVVATVVDPTASTSALSVVHIESQVAGSVTVRVQNTAVGSLTGTLNLIALHD